MLAGAALLAACDASPSTGPTTRPEQTTFPTASESPAGSEEPTATAVGSLNPTIGPGLTPPPEAPTTSPGPPSEACGSTDEHRAFFRQAAASMSWPVYCAVLPDGWFLEAGTYRLADGGRLEVTYRGPDDARLSLVEGNVCAGTDVEVCAPRDAIIGPAAFGDREGELGRLSNGLVLDVDRGAMPSWRATALGLSEDEFRALTAAFLVASG